MAIDTSPVEPGGRARARAGPYGEALVEPAYAILIVLMAVLYYRACTEMVGVWLLVDSYYSHGFLVPIVSLCVLWRQRRQLGAAARKPCLWGYGWILGAGFLLLIGDFLGFRVFTQLSMVPMISGLALVVQGSERTRMAWFAILYLVFMIPIPPSVTQSFALNLKLFATQCAVRLANCLTVPVVQDGSSVFWAVGEGTDSLMIGEVCGGLRSLIALLAFGALMAYLSKTRFWGRLVILAMSAPIAVIANVFRIFILCVIGYLYGSDVAAGTVHDVSGYMIFVVAFILFFALEAQLRRIAPADRGAGDSS